jgi:hypothetical protein
LILESLILQSLGSNNMEQIGDTIKQAQEQHSRTSKHLKQFAMALISTSLLIVDWWLIRDALFGGMSASFWVWPVSVTALWITFISFFALINPDRWTFFTFNAIGFIAFLVIMPRDAYVFLGGLLFFLLSLQFQKRIKSEETNQLNFSIRRTLGNSQNVIVYALLVLIGFMVYSNTSADFKRNPEAFYKRLSEAAVKGLPYVSDDRSQYNLNQTMEEFFRKRATQEFPNFNEVSVDQQRILLSMIENNFTTQFGVSADRNESLRVAMTEVVVERLRESLGRFERFFPLVFTLLVVALLKTFAFVFNWIVLFLSWVIYKLLLAFKFFRITKEMVQVEKLEI